MADRVPMFDSSASQLLAQQARLLGETVDIYVGRAVAYRLLAQLERQGDTRSDEYRAVFASSGLLPALSPRALFGPRSGSGLPEPTGAGAPTNDDTLQALVGLAAEALGVPAGIAVIVDRDRHVFQRLSVSTTTGCSSSDDRVQRSVAQRITESGQPLIVADALLDLDLREYPAVLNGLQRSFLGFPIASRDGHTLGAFCVADTRVRHWTRGHIEIAEHFAERIRDHVVRADGAD